MWPFCQFANKRLPGFLLQNCRRHDRTNDISLNRVESKRLTNQANVVSQYPASQCLSIHSSRLGPQVLWCSVQSCRRTGKPKGMALMMDTWQLSTVLGLSTVPCSCGWLEPQQKPAISASHDGCRTRAAAGTTLPQIKVVCSLQLTLNNKAVNTQNPCFLLNPTSAGLLCLIHDDGTCGGLGRKHGQLLWRLIVTRYKRAWWVPAAHSSRSR